MVRMRVLNAVAIRPPRGLLSSHADLDARPYMRNLKNSRMHCGGGKALWLFRDA